MQVATIGLDLAKNDFQLHGIAADDEIAFNRPFRRAQLQPLFSKLDPCLIGMETCGSAHHWAAEDITLGEVLDLAKIANEVILNLSEQLISVHKRIRWHKDRLKQVANIHGQPKMDKVSIR